MLPILGEHFVGLTLLVTWDLDTSLLLGWDVVKALERRC